MIESQRHQREFSNWNYMSERLRAKGAPEVSFEILMSASGAKLLLSGLGQTTGHLTPFRSDQYDSCTRLLRRGNRRLTPPLKHPLDFISFRFGRLFLPAVLHLLMLSASLCERRALLRLYSKYSRSQLR